MRLAVLRASGPDWDAQAFLRQHHVHTDAVWCAGDRFAGRIRTESGFNLTIADAASGSELAGQIAAWLRQNAAILQALVSAGVQSEIDVGLGPEGRDEFDVSVRLGPSDLAILARSGTTLVFSAYPRSS
jgi:hypothetical protein